MLQYFFKFFLGFGRQIRSFIPSSLAILCVAGVLSCNVRGGTTTINGPVNITVDAVVYTTYYSTTGYNFIDENYTQPIGSSVTAPTDFPNVLVGIKDATALFSQPWWVGAGEPSGAKAQAAAIAWYNAPGFPINDGIRLPNGTQTPYFAYATGDSSDQVRYAYAYFDTGSGQVVSSIAQAELSDTFSYALAGPVAGTPGPPVAVPEPASILLWASIGLAGGYGQLRRKLRLWAASTASRI